MPARSPITVRDVAYCEAGLDYAIRPHSHNAYQWYCVLYGTVDTVVSGERFGLGAEESILIAPGAVRSPRCRDKAPGYIRALFENHSLMLDDVTGRVLSMPVELRQDLHALVDELRHPGPDTHHLVDALLVRLIIGLRRGTLESSSGAGQAATRNVLAQQEIVSRVEAFMRRNLHRRLLRQDMAGAVHLSPAHLARIFSRVTGQTLIERLSELRVEYAKQLLLESTLSISEISLQVGYSSFSHFGKVFKAAVGIPPSDYRRSQGHTWRKP